MDKYTPDPFWNNGDTDSSSQSSDNADQNVYNNNYDNNYNNGYDNNSYDNNYNNGYDNNSYDNNYNNGYDNNSYDNNYNNGYNNNSYDNNYNNNGYYNNSYDNNYNNGYNYNSYSDYQSYAPENSPKFSLWVALAIANFLLCSSIGGAACLFLIMKANRYFKCAMYDKYESNLRIYKIVLILTAIVGLAVTVMGFMAM